MMKAAELELAPSDIQPERNLLAAVIWRALADLDDTAITHKVHRAEARDWLLEPSSKQDLGSFAWYCEQLFEGEADFWMRLIRKGAEGLLCEENTPEARAAKFNAEGRKRDFRNFEISQRSGLQTLPLPLRAIKGGKQ